MSNQKTYFVKFYNNSQNSSLFCTTLKVNEPSEDLTFKLNNQEISLINISKIIQIEENSQLEFNIIIFNNRKWHRKEYKSALNEYKITNEYISNDSKFKMHGKKYSGYIINISCDNQDEIIKIYYYISKSLTNYQNIDIKKQTRKKIPK